MEASGDGLPWMGWDAASSQESPPPIPNPRHFFSPLEQFLGANFLGLAIQLNLAISNS